MARTMSGWYTNKCPWVNILPAHWYINFNCLTLNVFRFLVHVQRCDYYTPLLSEHLLHSFVMAANIL